MRVPLKLLSYSAGAMLLLCSAGSGRTWGQVSGLYLWPPGPFELHYYRHGASRFQRRPYYAENPPVYYLPGVVARSYGWTPYPYPGLDYYRPTRARGDERSDRATESEQATRGRSKVQRRRVQVQQRRLTRWLDPQMIRQRHAMYVRELSAAVRRDKPKRRRQQR
jgi:hypothetical protein